MEVPPNKIVRMGAYKLKSEVAILVGPDATIEGHARAKPNGLVDEDEAIDVGSFSCHPIMSNICFSYTMSA